MCYAAIDTSTRQRREGEERDVRGAVFVRRLRRSSHRVRRTASKACAVTATGSLTQCPWRSSRRTLRRSHGGTFAMSAKMLLRVAAIFLERLHSDWLNAANIFFFHGPPPNAR
ncbi:unnamed protein product, partial [Ectocarpus sp. 12 AP-2014]